MCLQLEPSYALASKRHDWKIHYSHNLQKFLFSPWQVPIDSYVQKLPTEAPCANIPGWLQRFCLPKNSNSAGKQKNQKNHSQIKQLVNANQ